jgi:ABC-type dipeptide/oligopeptide/nickel transport system ATPase component
MAGLLELRDLTVELPTPSGWVRPVNGVSVALDERETLGIVGESGSGKTMLSLALMGLTPPGARRSGEAWLAGRSNNDNDAERDARNDAGPAVAAARRSTPQLADRQLPGNALGARRRDRHDISGADDRAESGDAHRRANRRSDSRPPAGRYLAAIERSALDSMQRACHSQRAHPRASISAPTIRRPAPARHDCHGASPGPTPADR